MPELIDCHCININLAFDLHMVPAIDCISGITEAICRLLDCIPFWDEIIRRCRRTQIDSLPDRVLVSAIFCRSFPTLKDVAIAHSVCKRWNSLLNSLEFRRLWCENRTDIEHWMINSSSASVDESPWPETKWIAAERLLSACDSDIGPHKYVGNVAVPVKKLASSHGLVCWACRDNESKHLRIALGNPRTRKWKVLPPFPAAVAAEDSLWSTAHAFGDSSVLDLDCRFHSQSCCWPLLEYDVRWHDAHGVEWNDSEAAARDCRTSGAGRAAEGCRPSAARLNLVHAPDIWSSP